MATPIRQNQQLRHSIQANSPKAMGPRKYRINPSDIAKKPVDVREIPTVTFYRATCGKDVMQVRILTHEERKANGRKTPDVEVKSYLYGLMQAYRADLKGFIGTDGAPIRLNRLATNKIYRMYRNLPTEMRIVVLKPTEVHISKKGKPSRIVYVLDGKELDSTKYIAFEANEAWEPIFERKYEFNEEWFRKLTRARDDDNSVKIRARRWKEQQEMTAQEKFLRAEYRAVAKIEDPRNFQLIGFILSYLQNGKNIESSFYITTVMELAKEHRIRNMGFVKIQDMEQTSDGSLTGNTQTSSNYGAPQIVQQDEELVLFYGSINELPTAYLQFQ